MCLFRQVIFRCIVQCLKLKKVQTIHHQLGCVKLQSLDGFQSILFLFTFLDQSEEKLILIFTFMENALFGMAVFTPVLPKAKLRLLQLLSQTSTYTGGK